MFWKIYRKTSESDIKESSDLVDDGHAWRKYGQKQILNSTYPRYEIFNNDRVDVIDVQLIHIFYICFYISIYNNYNKMNVYAGTTLGAHINMIRNVKQANKYRKSKTTHKDLEQHTMDITLAKLFLEFHK